MRADVNKLMGGELGSWLDEQQTMRLHAKETAHSRWTIAAMVLLPALAFLWFGPNWGGTLKLMISFVAVGGGYAWGYAPIQKAKREIKIGINSAIAGEIGVHYQHDVEPGHEFDAAKTYGLVPGCDRSSFEDHWYGELEGHGFSLYEAHLEERRGSGKNRRWVTVFRGAVIRLEFGRKFRSTTLLQRAGKHKKWFGLGGRKDRVSFDGHELAFVDQVHPAFEDVFEVWSDDQVEARVLVDPAYVEHLIGIERAFKGDAVRALFSKGEVIIAIESGNLFESGHIDSDGDRERADETAKQFASLAKLALSINKVERGAGTPPSGSAIDDARDNGASASTLGAGLGGGFGRKGI
ncbi:MAG: DUF3137 domain-containing protein [Pseudomonadota bacterium]